MIINRGKTYACALERALTDVLDAGAADLYYESDERFDTLYTALSLEWAGVRLTPLMEAARAWGLKHGPTLADRKRALIKNIKANGGFFDPKSGV